MFVLLLVGLLICVFVVFKCLRRNTLKLYPTNAVVYLLGANACRPVVTIVSLKRSKRSTI